MTDDRARTPTDTPKRPWLAAALILGFALLLGQALQRGLAFYQPPPPAVDLGDARWIGAEGSPPRLFLRRSWSIGTPPRSATLAVAASDRFDVYLNGTAVARGELLGAHPAQQVDVSRLLGPGQNVLALDVTRVSSRLQTAAAVLLGWDEGGQWQTLSSDGRWQVQTRFQLDSNRQTPWFDPAYDASRWPLALDKAGIDGRTTPEPGALPPVLVGPPPAMIAFWQTDRTSRVGTFALQLPLETREVNAAWIGVAAAGVQTLAVNGLALEPVYGRANRLDLRDIAPYLQPGDNRIALQVTAVEAPVQVTVAGRVLTPQGVLEIGHAARWQLAPHGTPVTVLPVADPPPAMAVVRAAMPNGWQWRQAVLGLLGSAGMALAIGLVVRWQLGAEASPAAWVRLARPLAAASLPLLGAWLVDLDPRWSLVGGHALAVAAAALALALALSWPRRASGRSRALVPEPPGRRADT